MAGLRWEGKDEVVFHIKEWFKCTKLTGNQRENSRKLVSRR